MWICIRGSVEARRCRSFPDAWRTAKLCCRSRKWWYRDSALHNRSSSQGKQLDRRHLDPPHRGSRPPNSPASACRGRPAFLHNASFPEARGTRCGRNAADMGEKLPRILALVIGPAASPMSQMVPNTPMKRKAEEDWGGDRLFALTSCAA